MITLHNSMTRKNEELRPIDPENVKMYVCGITAYDTPHVGNARPAVVFDVLYRLLALDYPRVTYVRNFTDIDDKIINKAKISGETIFELSQRYIDDYREVTESILGCLPPTIAPKATESIAEMIAMIGDLITKGHAYIGDDHVLFDTQSHADHGTLSRHLQENLRPGERVKVESYKRNPHDFVLWKPSSAEQPGWESPWGRGRPGWHIECSAMIREHLGQTIDIHGGGNDLKFPHHDCEISQSTCANDAPLANLWVHNGMVLVDGKKMGKSDGNFVTIRDAHTKHHGDTIRLALLSTHYRSPLDWTRELLDNSANVLASWKNVLVGAEPENNRHAKDILRSLRHDLNLPGVIGSIHAYIASFKENRNMDIAQGILFAASVLGFDLRKKVENLPENILKMISKRDEARARKDFATSDAIREEIASFGYAVRDGKNGTECEKI